ncbi:MAG: hypothetical protein WDN66_03485 [Candidatus Saccharibacteria bacterium]
MNTPELTHQSRNNAEPVRQLLAHLVDKTPTGSETDLQEQSDTVWGQYRRLELTQDDVTGSFGLESLKGRFGALGGLAAVFVELTTDEGPKRVQLRMEEDEPAFDVRPIEPEIEPKSSDYAVISLEEGFDWSSIVDHARDTRNLDDRPLYLVAFRSKLKEGADIDTLLKYDESAHEAALTSPALIHYFKGDTDELGQSLSFCLWTDPESAKAISQDERHTAATQMVTSYETYSIEKYDLHHTDGASHLELRT